MQKCLEDRLLHHLQQTVGTITDPLYAPANYALFGRAKRLRPRLLLSLLENKEAGLDAACSIEFIHTYSLIHDDLPCMDNDSMRRGRPTLHCQFSAGLATLTGDFFLGSAFEIISQSESLSDSCKVQLIQALSQCIGPQGLLGGQALDIEQQDLSALPRDLKQKIHQKKTGALFNACITCALIIEPNTPSKSLALQRFGHYYGLAYQMADDIADQNSPVQDCEYLLHYKEQSKRMLDMHPPMPPFLYQLVESL